MSTTTPTEKCSIEGCKRPYRSKGFCNVHFRKWRRGELEQKSRYKTCSSEGCRKPIGLHRGLCEEHYKSWMAARKPEVTASAEAPAASE